MFAVPFSMIWMVSEKHPYLPNWRRFIRLWMTMNNFIVSVKFFSKGLCIFTTECFFELTFAVLLFNF